MVKLKYLFLMCFTICACNNWYIDKCGHSQPKRPHYRLASKYKFMPSNLDTINIYRSIGSFDEKNQRIEVGEENAKAVSYLKFYGGGKSSSFGVYNASLLNQENLNPICHIKEYYIFLNNGNMIKIETFVSGDGRGFYYSEKLSISNNGDTLVSELRDNEKRIYVKELIPKTWKQYKPSW